ncbi:MAG TPA: hypothetical protein VMJ30_01290 [Gemmatimonadales bacterium]|nr:hypothetical protein [Gemmatimonadales bacterium]
MTVAAAALLLGLVYLFPLWQIALKAPQYPEGLGLRIWVNRITGVAPQDLNSINNLNHYIGMKRIEADDIPELRFMPWIVMGLIGSGLLVAAVGKRGLLRGWVILLGLVAVVGLADFWKWGYNYGHNLDPDAIITIPGMSYQPPLIGHKQLLNFSATSWPAAGGWAIVAALLLGVMAIRLTQRPPRARAASGSIE